MKKISQRESYKDLIKIANENFTELQTGFTQFHIFNGVALPEGTAPDILFIDSGIVGDLTSESLTINVPANYYPVSLLTLNLDPLDHCVDDILLRYDDTPVLQGLEMGVPPGSTALCSIMPTSVNPGPLNVAYMLRSEYYLDISDIIASRTIIQCQRTGFSVPIPVPQVINSTISAIGQLVIYLDSIIRKSLDYSIGIIVYINGIEQPIDACFSLTDTAELYCYLEEIEGGLLATDIVTISLSADYFINIWGGVLAPVVNYPVTNLAVPIPHIINCTVSRYGDLSIYFDTPINACLDYEPATTVLVNGSEYPVDAFYVAAPAAIVHCFLEDCDLAASDVITITLAANTFFNIYGGLLAAVNAHPVTNLSLA
ncbi:MAG: hypothetical protein ACOYMF_11935 [Bacteroidales bacterium]